MATTFLDVGLLRAVQIIFPFILTWVVVFGLLESKKVFGDKKGLHAIIGFVFGVFVILSPSVTGVIQIMAPWFLVILMLFLFSILLFKMFGLEDKHLLQALTGESQQLMWWIILISAIIFLSSIGSVYFQQPLSGEGQVQVAEDATVDGTGTGAFFQTLFHPKILGMVFVLVIATFTIVLLSGAPKK